MDLAVSPALYVAQGASEESLETLALCALVRAERAAAARDWGGVRTCLAYRAAAIDAARTMRPHWRLARDTFDAKEAMVALIARFVGGGV